MPRMRFNPYDPELHEDPYPVYQRLRDEFPVYHESHGDFWVLSRYEDVAHALQQPELFCSSQGIAVGLDPGRQAIQKVPLLIMTDGKQHADLRALVNRSFRRHRIAGLEPRIRRIARGLLEPMMKKRHADLVRDFAAPFPTIVIAQLLGVPEEDQDWFKQISNRITQFDPARAEGVHPAAEAGPAVELATYLSGVIDMRRSVPRKDLLSQLLRAEIDGRALSPQELIGFAFLLLVAGNETTTNLISNGAILLDQHRQAREHLIADPARIPLAVEECLRYESPVQGLARTTTADVELHGCPIPEGSKVLLLFASANRDERKISAPERFDVARNPNPHLAFGFGTHFCLGASLARLEARVAFEELLALMPDHRMTCAHVERVCSGPIRGAATLPIETDEGWGLIE